MRRIGIDVGGTNTDAVVLDDGLVVHAIKTPTTPDVTTGILTALAGLADHSDVTGRTIDGVVIGTTHFVNAVVQRRDLTRVAAVRIGLPASASLPPFCDWPEDLAGSSAARCSCWKAGMITMAGRSCRSTKGMRAAARQIRDLGCAPPQSPRRSRRSIEP
jgi:N-methylhydantoinase A/oxoprolinase/acetone carboxylase beta subunit